MTEPRIRPGRLRDTGPVIGAFARLAGLVTGTNPPHVFTTLGRHRGLFWGWLHFAGRLMPGGTLPRRDSEMVILRVAHLRGCAYELVQHRRLGKRAGLSDERIAALGEDLTHGPWTDREMTLLRTVDSLVARRDLDDQEWADLSAELDAPSAIELVLLVGHYDMLATTLLTLRVQPDAPSRLSRLRGHRRSAATTIR